MPQCRSAQPSTTVTSSSGCPRRSAVLTGIVNHGEPPGRLILLRLCQWPFEKAARVVDDVRVATTYEIKESLPGKVRRLNDGQALHSFGSRLPAAATCIAASYLGRTCLSNADGSRRAGRCRAQRGGREVPRGVLHQPSKSRFYCVDMPMSLKLMAPVVLSAEMRRIDTDPPQQDPQQHGNERRLVSAKIRSVRAE